MQGTSRTRCEGCCAGGPAPTARSRHTSSPTVTGGGGGFDSVAPRIRPSPRAYLRPLHAPVRANVAVQHHARAQPEQHPDLLQALLRPPRPQNAQPALLLQCARARRVRVRLDPARGILEGHDGVADELACRGRRSLLTSLARSLHTSLRSSSLPPAFSNARTHARTPARTHARTHARSHARTLRSAYSRSDAGAKWIRLLRLSRCSLRGRPTTLGHAPRPARPPPHNYLRPDPGGEAPSHDPSPGRAPAPKISPGMGSRSQPLQLEQSSHP